MVNGGWFGKSYGIDPESARSPDFLIFVTPAAGSLA
jgi:hypothetical protein